MLEFMRRHRGQLWVGLGLAIVVAVLYWYDGVLSKFFTSLGGLCPAVVMVGYWMGHGLVQGGLLLVILVVVYRLHFESWRPAVKQGAWAFALSGILVQVVKHLVGRPRPRLWEQGVRHFGPTMVSGFDSFPSGHTATSMAIALVLAYHFPRLGPIFLAMAAFVAASRVLGGSHFFTDVLGGMVLGLAVGWAVIKYFGKASKNR